MTVETLIRHAATRAICADEARAAQLRASLPQALAKLPAMLDAALPQALASAGLAPDATIALRRLTLDVRIAADAGPVEMAHAWAQAIVVALAGQLPAATNRTGGAPDDSTVHPDRWAAELAVLRALAAGGPAPWWAWYDDPATILAAWIERDPVRAAHTLLDLAQTEPAVIDLLSADRVVRMAARLAERLSARLAELGPGRRDARAADASILAADWPSALHQPIAALPDRTQLLFRLAALIVEHPAHAAQLAAAGSEALLRALADAPTAPSAPASQADAAPLAEIFGGGLLLLLRPLLAAIPAAAIDRDRLGMVGLAALRRCLAPLHPTARRLALERDRPLLAVFSGKPMPEGPLDLPGIPGEAEAWLDRLVPALPPADWAPSALRRCYGDAVPFADAPQTARLARLVMRPGLLAATPWSAELLWPAESADIAIRRAGWDIDPGWLPWIGRSIAFRYGAPE